MIVLASDGELRLVTQPDHAHFAAAALGLFTTPALLAHPRRDGLLRAVREHDNGWRELDAAPPVDPASGEPHDFRSLPRPLRLELWERGSGRFAAVDPYAALLATEHALALHAAREAEEGWRDLLPRLRERREELLAACSLSLPELAADYAWLELADRLSLAACAGWGEPFAGAGFAGRAEPGRLLLSPFPLAGATTLRVPCRRLPRRRWAGDAELGSALAAAPWSSFTVRIEAGDGDAAPPPRQRGG